MLRLWILGLSIIFSLALIIYTNAKPVHLELLNTNCTFNPKYFKYYNITIMKEALNADMELLRPIQRGFKAHINYELKIANAKNFQTVFTRDFDVCATVSSIKDGLFKNLFKSMKEHGNFMPNCPVEPGHYYMHNWSTNSHETYQFLYPGTYRSTMHFYYGRFETKSEIRVLSLCLELVRSN